VVEELGAVAEVEVANVLPGYDHYLADDSDGCSVLCFGHCRHGGCHAEMAVGTEKDDTAAVVADAGIDCHLLVSWW